MGPAAAEPEGPAGDSWARAYQRGAAGPDTCWSLAPVSTARSLGQLCAEEAVACLAALPPGPAEAVPMEEDRVSQADTIYVAEPAGPATCPHLGNRPAAVASDGELRPATGPELGA